MKTVASILVVPALLCALAGQGRADESGPAPMGTWYGYKIMLADAASLGAVVLGTQAEAATPLVFLGAGPYLGAPAVIHGIHHHNGRAVASVLMRLAFPVIGAWVGSGMEDCSSSSEWFCGLDGLALGFAGGMVAAMIIDAGIAWDAPSTQTLPTPPPKVSNRPSLTTAGIAPTRNGAQLVLGGSF